MSLVHLTLNGVLKAWEPEGSVATQWSRALMICELTKWKFVALPEPRVGIFLPSATVGWLRVSCQCA